MDWEDGHVAFNRSGDAAHGYRVTYDNASRIVHELDLTLRQEDNVAVRTITTNNYGSGASYALGTLVSSTVHSETDFGTVSDTTTTNTIAWYEGAVTTRTRIVTDYANATPDTDFATDYGYSAGGTLTTATITDARPRTVAFRSDVLGQVIRRDETDGNAATGDPHALWYGYDGRRIGTVGNDGSSDVGYGDSIDARQFQPNTTKPQGAFQNGASSGIGYARFGQGYDTVTSFAQGAGGGLYTANAGDTLSSIALQVWGDAALWYKLAQANGLSEDASLAEGRTLTIPGGVLRSGNSASTFKPYDPSERMGDTSPTTPKPQAAAAHKKGCGVFGAIILIAIAVAVTVVTAGAAAAAAAPGLTLGQGITVALGGSAVLGGATVSATAIGLASFGAIGAVAGSIVSQGIGVATGLQDKFSWKSVALAGLAGGIGGGLGSVIRGGGALAGVARGIAGSAATQGIAVATGLQSKFDWAGVAVAGVIGGVGSWASARLPGAATPLAPATFGNQLGASAASALAGASARSILTGTDFGDNILASLTDVIGNTIGNMVAQGITSLGKSDDIIVTSNGGRKGDVISDGTISDPALQGLVDKAKGYNLRGLENDYEDARSDAGEIRAKLTAAKRDGESAKRIASLEQKLAQREARVLNTAKAFEPALVADRAVQNYFAGKDVVVLSGGVESSYKIRGSSATFTTADDAAFDAIATARVLSAAMSDNVERTGYIVSRPSGGFTYEYPYTVSGVGSVMKTYSIGRELNAPVDQFPIPRNAVGMWHTHPKGGGGDDAANVYFGPADIKAAQQVSARISSSSFAAYLGGSDGGVRVIRNANTYRSGFDGSKVPKADYLMVGPGYLRLH